MLNALHANTGALPRGKSSLQVVKVGDATSTCKLTRSVPGRPIVRNNVIANAIQAVTPPDGHVQVTCQKTEQTVDIAVTDNGTGISPEVLEHIFEPYYTTKEEGKGTGLGLSISYGLIREMNGTIHVTTELNLGTKFTITLPL